jgi:hypothetical protein
VEKDYEELLGLFNKNKVKYCVIGAYAVGFHAWPRYSKDIDILVEPSSENAKRIVRALDEFGFKSLGLEERDFAKEGKIIQLGYEPVRVDILTSIEGLDFKQAWKSKVLGNYGKERIFFLGINELIKNKRKSRRSQDRADLERLLVAKKKLTK